MTVNGEIYSGGSCWSDLPIHMQMAESFLQGRNQEVCRWAVKWR